MSAPPIARPIPGPPRPFQFPAFERRTLPNGLELIVAPVRRLPLVTIRFVLDVGARQESREQAGIASLTASALAEGTQRLDAAALAEEFERLGGSLLSYATWDATQVQTTVMSNRFAAALSLLVEVVTTPALPEREVERLKAERLAELLELKSEPRGLADDRFTSSLYNPTSRLSVQEAGSERTVKAISVESSRAWHSSEFTPSGTALVVVGDVDSDEVHRIVEQELGGWNAGVPRVTSVDDGPARKYKSVRVLDRPEAPQSELRLGHVGLPRLHPDYFDLVVMNAILGGVFNSRINLNLRERNAFTYSAFSSFEWRRDAGPFVVSTAVATPVTGSAVREVLVELERIRSAEPTADELSLSTSYLDGVFPIRFETTDAIASALANLRTQRLPNDYYDTYRDRIRSVTAPKVLRAAQQHLHPDLLQVLAVGDRAHIATALGELDLGPLMVIGDDDE
jgi:zinc protease